MSITQLQPFNLDSTASYTLGNVTVSGNITAGGGTVSPSVLVTNIQITDSSFTVLDDTAVSTSGGYIKITGSGFAAGTTVVIGSVSASSVAIVSSTVLNVQVPAQAAGTYTVYVVNTSGAVGIRVNGLNYSGTPTWTTTSPLTGGTVNTAISIQLAATGDAPLTYALQAGSTLPSGLSLSSSGLLSGTVTGITVTTTYNFTVVATDAQAQDTPQAFSITITAGDQYFDYTTLLLSANTPSSTFVTDASSNSFAVTVNGDTIPNNFGPYTPGYYSNFFDGTGDYLRVASTGAGFSSITTFTYECWIYPTAALSTNCIFDISESQPFRFVLSGSNVTWQASSSGTTILTATFTWVIGAWHHVAFVRDSSNNVSIFINGTRYATTTYGSWGSTGANGVNIGCNRGDTWFFPGYISNARFVKGTAVYDPTQTTITVPTTPLTAVSGTSLLTCQSNRFIDNSADNLTVTRNGDVTVNSFDPFVPSSSYSTYGSGYFDGTGDYLSVGSNSAFAIAGDFTIEGWFMLTGTTGQGGSGEQGILGCGIVNPSRWTVRVTGTSTKNMSWWLNTPSNQVVGSTAILQNVWYHFALVRSGSASNNVKLYLNGVLDSQATSTYSIPGESLVVGRTYTNSDSEYWNGYLSNIRIVNGTAVYTAAFTPPTSPLTAVSGTSLLTLQSNTPNNNNMFADNSSNNFLLTRNGNTTQGTFSPYTENWSNYFDGTSDSISYTGGSSLNFGTSDFTIETWAFLTNTGTFSAFIRPDDSGAFPEWGYDFSSSQLKFDARNGSIVSTSTSMPVNQWVHLAVSRSGTSLRQFVNGTQVGSTTTNSTNFGSTTGVIRIGGSSFSGSHSVNGYLSNFRVVKGTALYTTTFTPSTTPLQPIANTSLLTCADNRFIDDSPNNFTITRNGDVTVQKFGPFSSVTLPTPYYGAYFDGTGDYIYANSSGSAFTYTGDFTIEFWVYPISAQVGTYNPTFFTNNANGEWSANSVGIRIQYGVAILGSDGGFTTLTFTNPLVQNQWQHVALVRSGSTVTMYRNGTANGTATYSGTLGYNGCWPALATSDRAGTGGREYPTAYFSNWRIVKGQALYTTTFTPSTTPLTTTSQGATASNVSLLTCQSATFVDNSTNNFAIIASGNSQPTKYNPFTVSYSTLQSYSPSVFGGSMYFDGTGDYLSVADNIALDAFTDFTIEGWVYFNSAADNQVIVNKGWDASSTFSPYIILTSGGNLVFTASTDGSTWALLNQTIIPSITTGRWYHFAVTRSGSTVRYFNNGALTGTSTLSAALMNSIYALNVGSHRTGGNYLNGYISDLRLVKGTAIYTSNFVPTNAPLTAVQNTVLLLNGTSSGITDVTTGNNFESLGNSQISTSVKNYGNSSMYFDGTGDYCKSVVPSPNFAFGTGNFTIECWIYRAGNGSNPTVHECVFGTRVGAGGFAANQFQVYTLSSQQLWFQARTNSYDSQFGSSSLSMNNSWNHIAVVRTATNITLYFNGVSVASETINAVTQIGDTTNRFNIGAFGDGSYTFNGYVQDLRVTKGIARYTANFTPPSTPFIAYGN